MTDFRFNRLVIFSRTEGKSKVIDFHPDTTVITAPNHLGKSFILKTLFWTLGAETKVSETWKSARISALLYATLGEEKLTILRDGKEFTVFDGNSQVVGQFTKATSELGPFLAKRLRFGLRLASKSSNELVIPPPSFYFLPYYFDQDASWNEPWASFKGLDQMLRWKTELVEYHTGIKPNSYYDLGSERLQLLKIRDDTQAEVEMVKRIRDELADQLAVVAFQIDLAVFEEEITKILKDCETIQATADRVRERLVQLHNDFIEVDAQIGMVTSSLRELGKDYQFGKSFGDHVECPLCRASYPSDFSQIFEIALNQDQCEELLSRLKEERTKIKEAIASESQKHSRHEEEVARIKALLAQKKEEVSLGDLIDSESKKEVSTRLKGKIDKLSVLLYDSQSKVSDIDKKLKAMLSKERKAEILGFFKQRMKEYFLQLGVMVVPDEKIKNVAAPVFEGGSYQPRALLGYGFSILATMRKAFAGSDAPVFAPIVIDSPIQQEQDTENHVRVMEFLKKHRPAGAQMIIGVVDPKGVDFGGQVLRLDNAPRSLLSEENYSDAIAEVDPYFQKAFAYGQGLLL
jgi:hypothetical protein